MLQHVSISQVHGLDTQVHLLIMLLWDQCRLLVSCSHCRCSMSVGPNIAVAANELGDDDTHDVRETAVTTISGAGDKPTSNKHVVMIVLCVTYG